MKRYSIPLTLLFLLFLIFPYTMSKNENKIQHLNPSILTQELPQKFPRLLNTSELNQINKQNFEESTLLQLVNSPDFNIENLNIYAQCLNSETPSTVEYALQSAKYQNTKSNFYQDIYTVSNPNDILVLVNKNFALPDGYQPDDLVLLDVPLYNPSTTNEANYLRKEAAKAASELFEAAKKEEGYTLIARSGFRSYESQIAIYKDYYQQGGPSWADSYSARPNHSEHQTGLALDVTSDTVQLGIYPVFGASKEAAWVDKNAHRFGFIIRYPEDYVHETGYSYEPWHLRYVGVDAATEIYETNILLEDYLLNYGLIETN